MDLSSLINSSLVADREFNIAIRKLRIVDKSLKGAVVCPSDDESIVPAAADAKPVVVRGVVDVQVKIVETISIQTTNRIRNLRP